MNILEYGAREKWLDNSLSQFCEEIELSMSPPITMKNAVIRTEAKASGNQILKVSGEITPNTAKKHISQKP